MLETKRKTAQEIFESAAESGREELKRPSSDLIVSGIAGGALMGLTALGVAIMHHAVGFGGRADLIASLLYPLGFVAIIVGRGQLFTENTLFPVTLVLSERKHVFSTLRLWMVVLAGNLMGALLFALLAIKTRSLDDGLRATLIEVGTRANEGDFWRLFSSAIIGGWIIALVAWLVTASKFTIAQIAVTWLFTFVVGAGHFVHVIAGSAEVLSGVLGGSVALGTYGKWLLAATLGNTVGGVIMVALLNWGQISTERAENGKRTAQHRNEPPSILRAG